jgi:peptide/nickel transport system substrate-binding protein
MPEVIFRQVKDAVAQAQMLQSGEVDIAMQIDPETAKSLEGTPAVVERVPSYNFVYIALSPGAKATPIDMTPDVREAISIAIDRTSLIDFTLGGAGRPLAAPIPLGFPGGDGHAVPEYNPDKAKEMLAAAGHADGFTLLSIYPDLNVYGVDFNLMMQKIQQDLSKVGITLDLQPVPFANWREAANGDHIPLTAVFFAPDFFGTSQYVDVFGMHEGSVWAKRAGGENAAAIVNPRPGALKDAALAARDGGRGQQAVGRSGGRDDQQQDHHSDGQPRPDPGLWPEHQGRALQRLLQPASGGNHQLIPAGAPRGAPSFNRQRDPHDRAPCQFPRPCPA